MTNRCPLKLDLGAPSYMESQFPVFQIRSDCDKICPKPLKLTPVGAYGSKTIEGERFRKHIKDVTMKVPTTVTNMLRKSPKGGSPKVMFLPKLGMPHGITHGITHCSPLTLRFPKVHHLRFTLQTNMFVFLRP